ncbi:MAG: hypothetical protein K2K70_11460 [Lachnospiraceae bacterium]|nr:hypothetical protein [Lachnospiraceae bacterium]
MAVFVLMIKKEENEEKVVYKFGPNEEHMGIIEFDKVNRAFSIQKSVNDGIISNKAYEGWAAEKIVKLMYKEGGEFPDIVSVEK